MYVSYTIKLLISLSYSEFLSFLDMALRSCKGLGPLQIDTICAFFENNSLYFLFSETMINNMKQI